TQRLDFLGTPLTGTEFGANGPRAVTVSDDGLFVYAYGGTGSTVYGFDREPATGLRAASPFDLAFNFGIVGLSDASDMAMTPDGQRAYLVSQFDSGIVCIDCGGGPCNTQPFGATYDGDPGIDGIGGASSVDVSPDGNFLYVSGTFDDGVAVFDASSCDLANNF